MFMVVAYSVASGSLKPEQTTFDSVTNAVVTSTKYNSDGANIFGDTEFDSK